MIINHFDSLYPIAGMSVTVIHSAVNSAMHSGIHLTHLSPIQQCFFRNMDLEA